MSDNNNKKDTLEQFFKKSVEEYQVPFREEDWLTLEKKLDVLDAQRTYKKRLRWMAAASLLVISLLAWNIIENRARINSLMNQLAGTEMHDPGQVPVPDRSPEFQLLPELELAPDIEPGPIPEMPSQVASQPEVMPEPYLGSVRHGEMDEEIPGISVKSLDAGKVHEVPVTGGLSSLFADMSPPAAMDRMKPYEPYHFKDEENTIADRRHRTSGFEAGIQMSPNLTTVGSMMNAYESGYNIGISLGYRFMSRLTISTGMIYSHISYSAAENDYNLPDGYLQGGALREMKGECQILELPVSLQFRMVDFNQSRIYATAGISSYIMLGEKYEFHLEGYNESPGSVFNRNVRSGTRHWLSNAGLSIGYERDVYQSWSLRVEPYVRIPINEVGWTRVRLYSVGTFFSINYRM